MSGRHQLTERIITRVKAIAIFTEGDSVDKLTLEHFLMAFRSLESEKKIYEILQTLFEDVEEIQWPDGIKVFTQNEIEEIESLENSGDSKGINLSKELNRSYKNTSNTDCSIPLNLWLKELFISQKHPVLTEFAEINGGFTEPEESLYDQWKRVDEQVAMLKNELEGSLIGQPIAIAMIARAYRLKCLYPSTDGPRGVLTILGPRSASKAKLGKAFARALSAIEGEAYDFITDLTEVGNTDGPSVFFIDNIEEKDFSRALAQDLEKGKIGNANVSKTWIVIGTGLGSEFFGSANRSGILRGESTMREEIFDVLENEIVKDLFSERQAIDLELVDVLRGGSLVLLDSLSASEYFEVIDRFLEESSGKKYPLIPKISMDDDSKLLFLLSLIPNLSEANVVASMKHFVVKQVADARSQPGNNGGGGLSMDEINVKLDIVSKEFLEERKGQNALQIFLFDDDDRMGKFISQGFEGGLELELQTGVTLEDVNRFNPDIVLLDLDIKDKEGKLYGLDLHREIRESSPDLPVFLFSEKTARDCDVAEIARKGGARGYFHFQEEEEKPLSVAEEEKENFGKLLKDFQFNRLLEKQTVRRRQVRFQSTFEIVQDQSTVSVILKSPFEEAVCGSVLQGDGIGIAEHPNITFEDVFGLDRAKERLALVLDLLKRPRAVEKMGLRPPTGFLFTGPPGTGKTFLARAFAGEAEFPFFQLSAGQLSSKWIGESEERIRNLFANARKFAPSIIFIDEIDSIASARSGMGGGSHENYAKSLNQLLTCMDGFEKDDKYVFVMAATNRADLLDPAILRAGRFDEKIPFNLPSEKTRRKMLLAKFPDVFPDGGKDENLARVVARTAGFSPAEIDLVARESGYLAVNTNKEQRTFEHIDSACRQIKFGAENRDIKITPDDKTRTAWHEAGHAIARHYLFPEQTIDTITIIPTENGALGFVATNRDEDRHNCSLKEIQNELIVCLAGREAEQQAPGLDQAEGINSGASSDLKQATRLAYISITEFGLDEEFGEVSFAGLPQNIADDLGEAVHKRIKQLLDNAKKKTTAFLEKHKEALEKVAAELEKKDSIDGSRLEELLGGNTAASDPA